MEIGAEELKRGLRRILNDPKYQSKICLIFLGSSYRNRGVQPLMNAIIDYLPSPTEREPIQCINDPTKIRKPLKS